MAQKSLRKLLAALARVEREAWHLSVDEVGEDKPSRLRRLVFDRIMRDAESERELLEGWGSDGS